MKCIVRIIAKPIECLVSCLKSTSNLVMSIQESSNRLPLPIKVVTKSCLIVIRISLCTVIHSLELILFKKKRRALTKLSLVLDLDNTLISSQCGVPEGISDYFETRT